MPLYIRDHDVDVLAGKVQKALGFKTKTEAVRSALVLALNTSRASQPFDQRNAEALALAGSIGVPNPGFDMKAFTDEMWGDI